MFWSKETESFEGEPEGYEQPNCQLLVICRKESLTAGSIFKKNGTYDAYFFQNQKNRFLPEYCVIDKNGEGFWFWEDKFLEFFITFIKDMI